MNKRTIAIYIIVVLMFAWAFVRPPLLKHRCYDSAHDKAVAADTTPAYKLKLFDNAYSMCLKRNGL